MKLRSITMEKPPENHKALVYSLLNVVTSYSVSF